MPRCVPRRKIIAVLDLIGPLGRSIMPVAANLANVNRPMSHPRGLPRLQGRDKSALGDDCDKRNIDGRRCTTIACRPLQRARLLPSGCQFAAAADGSWSAAGDDPLEPRTFQRCGGAASHFAFDGLSDRSRRPSRFRMASRYRRGVDDSDAEPCGRCGHPGCRRARRGPATPSLTYRPDQPDRCRTSGLSGCQKVGDCAVEFHRPVHVGDMAGAGQLNIARAVELVVQLAHGRRGSVLFADQK